MKSDSTSTYTTRQSLFLMSAVLGCILIIISSLSATAFILIERMSAPSAEQVAQANDSSPIPTKEQATAMVQERAAKVNYPLYLPANLPPGLVLHYISNGSSDTIQYFIYTPQQEISANKAWHIVTISEQLGSYEQIREYAPLSRWLISGTETVLLDDRVSGRTSLRLMHGGTFIALDSSSFTSQELLKLARSLQPLPGGAPLLSNPTTPSISGLRKQVGFNVYVPTYLPAGLAPEPPRPNRDSDPAEVMVDYYYRNNYYNEVVLTVDNSSVSTKQAWCRDPSSNIDERVTMTDGSTALVHNDTSYLAICTERGTTQVAVVAWHGSVIRDELVKMAASLSATADLGETKLPNQPPIIPTAVP